MEPTWILLNFLLCAGCFAVCLAFVGLLPGVGNLLASMWLTVMGERIVKGENTGTRLEGIDT